MTRSFLVSGVRPVSKYSQSTLDQTTDLVGREPISALEVQQTYGFRCSSDAISRRLAALFRQGVLERRWDGNQRFGRYLYFR